MAAVATVTKNDLYAARIFFNSALPLLKVIVESVPKIGKKFQGKSFLFQVSALYPAAERGKMATYFDVKDGVFTVHVSELCEKPDIELEFSDLNKFILFFSGKGMPLPRANWLFPTTSQAISCMIFRGSEVAGVRLLPHIRAEAPVRVFSFNPNPF